ncbi:MAG: response regulator [Candidatus Eisenbacteria bacterium]|uniref:Response regulator n=1 Tax=Eiseniibacteriota bacterium TaxID=2212470 RepID=A0A933SB99_UNCEI|nr:response regulator [Candidatus Eisenbacteria bacterium]
MNTHSHGPNGAGERNSHEDDSQARPLGPLSDLTERRRLEDELRRMAYEAQEARADAESAASLVRAEAEELARERDQAAAHARASSEFIASMAHDLRTPLNGVLGMVEFLLHSSLTEEQRDQALTIRGSAESLVRLVGDIVDFSRAGAGQLEVQSEEFSVRDVVDDVARLLAQKAVAKGITFSATVASTVPDRMRGDAAHLRQVITNLASNAVRFTDEGSVTVALSRAPGILADGRVPLRIEVQDTDATLSAENLAALMDQRTGGGEKHPISGSAGLGLAISRRLVELMGGTIVVGSEPGRGSAISVEVPLERVAAAAQPAQPAQAPDFTLTMQPLDLRVLVAEDNAVNQKVATRMLQRWGITAHVVPDGRAAVEAVSTGAFDLVLMDVLMPRQNGFDATSEIRRHEAGTGRRIPVVAMTAHGLAQERERCFEAGMDGFVAKPIQAAELYAELAKWAEARDMAEGGRHAA